MPTTRTAVHTVSTARDKTGKNNIMFVLNMTPMKWENYKIGVPKKKKYKLLLNMRREAVRRKRKRDSRRDRGGEGAV